jgi:LEA14-like dessication related protein
MSLTLSLAACASTDPVEQPDVTLVDLRVGEVTVFETTLHAVVRVVNPSPEPLELEGASFKLDLEGRKIASGTAAASLSVPRLDSATMPVTFHVNNIAAFSKLRAVIEEEGFGWRLRGVLYSTGSWGRSRIRVERSGRLDLDETVASPVESSLPQS